MSKLTQPINCTIDRLENGKAVLKITISNQTQELIIPKRFLPDNIKEADTLLIEFSTQAGAAAKKKNLAHQVLAEILKVSK